MTETPGQITSLLADLRQGNTAAEGSLYALVYAELRRIAGRQFQKERAGHTLQPTALVNEAYVHLLSQRDKDWQNRAHFFGVAANVMRRILIDHAREHNAEKRGGGVQLLPVEGVAVSTSYDLAELLAIDQALQHLAEIDERQARIVELRFFGGLTEEEIAEVLGVTARTIKRDWKLARAWLHAALGR